MNHKKNYLSLIAILLLAILCWLFLKDVIGRSDGVGYGYLLEQGIIFHASEADHLLWHELSWLSFTIGRCIDPSMRGVMAEQIINLLLFLAALLALWRYLQRQGKPFWFAGLGIIASLTSLKTLISEDVDVGPLLMMTLLLTILPGVLERRRTLWTIIILALALLFHKSMLLLVAGWWLAEIALGGGRPIKRVLYASSVAFAAIIISLVYYFLTWLVFLSNAHASWGWYFPYGSSTTGFITFEPPVILTGLGASLYRSFFNIVPVKLYLMGNSWGSPGIILSFVSITLLIYLIIRALWKQRTITTENEKKPRTTTAVILSALPALLFFSFWMPGYSDYWCRFMPAFWVLLALRLPATTFVNWAKYSAIGILLLINLPSQFYAKDGEESGLIIRWIEPRVQPGDLLVIPGNGVFYSGVVPTYYCRADVLSIGDIWRAEDPIAYLKSKLAEKWRAGHNAWLLLDYSRWNSARLLYNDQTSVDSQIETIKQSFKIDPNAELRDPSLEEAWIGKFLPQ